MFERGPRDRGGVRRRGLALVLAALAAFVVAGGASAQEAGNPDETALIPRDLLFGEAERSNPLVSPDGTRLSFLAPVDGETQLWVGPVDDPGAAAPITSDPEGFEGTDARWTLTNRHMLYSDDEAGDEDYKVYSLDVQTGKSRLLTPVTQARAQVKELVLNPRTPEEVLIEINDRDPAFSDLYRLNVVTGEPRLVFENTREFDDVWTDEDYRPRLATRFTEDGMDYLRATDGGDWEPFFEIPFEDADLVFPISIVGDRLYMMDSRDRDTAALALIDMNTGEREILASDERADLDIGIAGDGVLVDPISREVLAARFDYDRSEWRALDPEMTADLAYLETVDEGNLGFVSRSLDGGRWTVGFSPDDGPTRYYLYDRALGEARFLFANNEAIEDQTLAPMRTSVVTARDGLELMAYHTLPPGTDPDGDGRPATPLPTVLLIHGGPQARDSWGFNPQHQWLANRGYAVLSVNFRGSTGYGKEHLSAGYGEYGKGMHDDLLDTVAWAVDEGIADPGRVAAMGSSYGGYATLWAMVDSPETFACGVSHVGMANLVTSVKNNPPTWSEDYEAKRTGEWRTEEGLADLEEHSPLTHVQNVEDPLLISQGANDPRVPVTEADQMVNAMVERDIPVTYVLFPDEGHGFSSDENTKAHYAVVENFLARDDCLGGRAEPVGDDFEGSSVTVPEGAELVPGVTEALGGSGEE